MTDRVDELACYLVRDGHMMEAQELQRVINERWPGITADEMQHAFAKAAEEKREDAAEDLAEADALERLAQAGISDEYEGGRS